MTDERREREHDVERRVFGLERNTTEKKLRERIELTWILQDKVFVFSNQKVP